MNETGEYKPIDIHLVDDTETGGDPDPDEPTKGPVDPYAPDDPKRDDDGSTTFFHGSDEETINDIVGSGINQEAAEELGGGDVFWLTEELGTAQTFALVNPRGGPPAVAGTTLPNRVVASLQARGVIRLDEATGAWQVVEWNEFNDVARFYRVE